MKKIGLLVLLVLALNFLVAAGGVGYLASSGALTKDRISEIGKILFPEPQPTGKPTTEPVEVVDENDPIRRLEKLLEPQPGQTPAEQIETLRAAFDAQMAQLERRRRELADLRRQIDAAQQQLLRDRADIDTREAALAQREKRVQDESADVGFKAALEVYNAMPTRQVKDIFMNLDQDVVVRYLQAMDSRRASRILKEFKTPEELSRAQTLLEEMRKSEPAVDAPGPPDAKASGSDAAAAANSR